MFAFSDIFSDVGSVCSILSLLLAVCPLIVAILHKLFHKRK